MTASGTGSINRARLSAYGTVATNVTWRIQGEFRAGSIVITQAQVKFQGSSHSANRRPCLS